jgi:HlyD family secretion protein
MLDAQPGGASPATGPTREVSVRTESDWSRFNLPGFSDSASDEFDEDVAGAGQPWWRRRSVLIVAAAVIVLAAILTPIALSRSRKAPVSYSTSAVRQGALTTSVSATGPLQAGTFNVNFSGSGTLTEIDVSVGQQVTAGQVLAKLDPTSLQDAVNSAQTSLNNAYTSRSNAYNQGNAQLNAAYQQEQNTIINTCNVMTDTTKKSSCINNAQAQFAQTQAQVATSESNAEAQVSSAQNSLNTAIHNLGNATLKAPHGGIIGAVNGQVGGTPGAGSSSGGSGGGSTFIQIVDLSALQVSADVNETDIGKIAVGQHITFTVSAYGTRTFTGTVTTVSPLGTATSGVVTYPVTSSVDANDLQGARLLPEMTANVTIITAQRTNVLLIPATAVTFARTQITAGAITRTSALTAFRQAGQMLRAATTSDPTAAQDNLQAAFVLERSHNQWVIKPVVLGLTNGTSYEVLAGLNSGESIVTGQQGATTSTSVTGTGNGLFGGGRGTFGGGNGGGRFGGGAGGGTGGGGQTVSGGN